MSEFVIITGLSGAGRSQAADALEDLGWFVIDNLPSELIPKVVELVRSPGSATPRVALVVGAGAHHAELLPGLGAMRSSGARVRQLYLDASTEVLVRRYESTRRRHPLLASGEGLADAIERERALLEPVKAEADVVVDTTALNVHELHSRILGLFGEERTDVGMQTRIVSFGYKHGLPVDVDVVLDCRFLPNPHWVEELRPLTGLDEPVRRYVLDQAGDRRVPRAPRRAPRPSCCRRTWPRARPTSRWRSVAREGATARWRSRRPWPGSCENGASSRPWCTATSTSDRPAELEPGGPICSDCPGLVTQTPRSSP